MYERVSVDHGCTLFDNGELYLFCAGQFRMATPLLIDTDMGIDDAVAVSLALASDALDVRAIVGVGGNVEAQQVTSNIGRLLAALSPSKMPIVGRGLDQSAPNLTDRRDLFGTDGLGECDLTAGRDLQSREFQEVYRHAIQEAPGELTILATGPLTNLAALLTESPEAMKQVARIYVSGGAVWTQGNVRGLAEFNFYRDPSAAAKVLTSGLPITVAPLDVTCFMCLDESHVAHLAASGYRTGLVLAKILQYAVGQDADPGVGKTHIQDAIAAGAILWPDLFLKTRMRLDVVTAGPEAGRCRPQLGGDPTQRVDLLTAVNAVDLLENVLESLCHEAFVV